MPSHYEVLGVEPDASPDEIRAAYRRAARRHHPDRHGEHSSGAMARVNEAYQVLSDPGRRAAYDRALAPDPSPPPAAAEPVTTARGEGWVARPDTTPARFPWRFVAFLAAVGIAVVIAGVIVYRPAPTPPPDNILRTGDCVVLSTSLEATEVNCTDPHDARVRVLVPFDQACPAGAEPFRDHQGLGTACVDRTTN